MTETKAPPPNPKGDSVTCVRCKSRATFTVEAVCATCRKAEGKSKRGGKDQVAR